MKSQQTEALQFGEPFVTVSRNVAGAILVTAGNGQPIEALPQVVVTGLINRGYKFNRFLSKGDPAWFLPRSLARQHSDISLREAEHIVELSGAILERGADKLKEARSIACSGHDTPTTGPHSLVPDLASYDLILVESSGGKDSLAMLAYVVKLAEAAGVKDCILVVHNDLGEVEWPQTTECVLAQAEYFGVDYRITPTRPRGGLLSQVLHEDGRFPGTGGTVRYCTSDQKTAQSAVLMTKLVSDFRTKHRLKDVGNERKVRILDCLGLRGEESTGRAEKPGFTEDDNRASNGLRDVDKWLPIQGWALEEVWRTIDDSGAPHHYAYDLGNERMSCMNCVFGSETDLLISIEVNPELAAKYAKVEDARQWTLQPHRSVKELAARVGVAPEIMDAATLPPVPPHMEGKAPRADRLRGLGDTSDGGLSLIG